MSYRCQVCDSPVTGNERHFNVLREIPASSKLTVVGDTVIRKNVPARNEIERQVKVCDRCLMELAAAVVNGMDQSRALAAAIRRYCTT